MGKLSRDFYDRDTVQTARALLGKYLVRRWHGLWLAGRITETEAYRGEEDTACHAHRGRTKRTEMLYRGGGAVYVYLCYGIHWLMNVITGPEDFPQGVLIRACAGFEGPGKLTRYLGITGALNGADIASSPLIRIEDEGREVYIRTAKRVGIAYADEADRDRLWRFIGEVR